MAKTVMPDLTAHLAPLDSQHDRLSVLVQSWADINTAADNLPGLATLAAHLHNAFAPLGDHASLITLPPYERIDALGHTVPAQVGQALHIIKHAPGRPRVFLCIHMDTVYPATSPFQRATLTAINRMQGPGVTDAKGGIAVMLAALETFSRSPLANDLAWEVLITPDEEIGSHASLPLLREAATRNHFGLLFEPALDDVGTLAGDRRGSGNFTLLVRGHSAHAGRNLSQGRNAIVAAAAAAISLDALNQSVPGTTVNVARVEGGAAFNVVPDLALLRFNTRADNPEALQRITQELNAITASVNARDGLSASLHGSFNSPPKSLASSAPLPDLLIHCGRQLGLSLQFKPTGGVCDGNKLAAAGLPNIDTLGPRGGAIHSPDEYLLTDSLVERAKLTALLLLHIAANNITPSNR